LAAQPVLAKILLDFHCDERQRWQQYQYQYQHQHQQQNMKKDKRSRRMTTKPPIQDEVLLRQCLDAAHELEEQQEQWLTGPSSPPMPLLPRFLGSEEEKDGGETAEATTTGKGGNRGLGLGAVMRDAVWPEAVPPPGSVVLSVSCGNSSCTWALHRTAASAGEREGISCSSAAETLESRKAMNKEEEGGRDERFETSQDDDWSVQESWKYVREAPLSESTTNRDALWVTRKR
jgi:hypothetical protein